MINEVLKIVLGYGLFVLGVTGGVFAAIVMIIRLLGEE